jgi:hypothetical protein
MFPQNQRQGKTSGSQGHFYAHPEEENAFEGERGYEKEDG